MGGGERWLTSAHGDPHEPEGHQPAHVHHYGEYEEGAAQDVVVGEEEEGLYQAETRNQAVLQGEMLLPHRRPAGRVLRRRNQNSQPRSFNGDNPGACPPLTSTLTWMVCNPLR